MTKIWGTLRILRGKESAQSWIMKRKAKKVSRRSKLSSPVLGRSQHKISIDHTVKLVSLLVAQRLEKAPLWIDKRRIWMTVFWFFSSFLYVKIVLRLKLSQIIVNKFLYNEALLASQLDGVVTYIANYIDTCRRQETNACMKRPRSRRNEAPKSVQS